VHVKGLEPPGYDPRVLKGMGLGYATSDRGACHLRATFYKAELGGLVAPDEVEGKARVFAEWEDRLTLMDALILCRFFRDLYLWDEVSLLLKGITGLELDKDDVRRIASRITNKAREFNVREGMTKEDDTLPRRFLEEGLADSGKVLPRSEFRQMLDEYYALRGWD